ncbi:MAG TPA: hypothetical protein VLA24_07405 [Pseudomonadales bacterium]|nr:hypothetical protein [Pseudomonadales bacterium]
MYRYRLCAELQLEPGADTRSPGGAVTIALCGHWEHKGACRWPHNNHVEPAASSHVMTIEFNCPAHELAEVQQRIQKALKGGRCIGPDGRENHWRLIKIDASPADI